MYFQHLQIVLTLVQLKMVRRSGGVSDQNSPEKISGGQRPETTGQPTTIPNTQLTHFLATP